MRQKEEKKAVERRTQLMRMEKRRDLHVHGEVAG
jgi:hypothetical protein